MWRVRKGNEYWVATQEDGLIELWARSPENLLKMVQRIADDDLKTRKCLGLNHLIRKLEITIGRRKRGKV